VILRGDFLMGKYYGLGVKIGGVKYYDGFGVLEISWLPKGHPAGPCLGPDAVPSRLPRIV
jgi:hypothetical protein